MVYSNGIVGTFVFRNEGDGCLTSKYVNETERIPYTEACWLRRADANNRVFAGEYETVWIEERGQRQEATLLIEEDNRNGGVFILRWTRDNVTLFAGIGMLVGDLLVGSYWDQDAGNRRNTTTF